MLVELSGQIERITYANEEDGYTIAKLKVYGQRELVTIVGNLMSPAPGEVLKIKGVWHNHPKYGEQFKITHYKTTVPANVHGIRKYLGSGLIKGLGPVMAERIVSKFGENTLDIIEKQIETLTKVNGIGKKRIKMISVAWQEQKDIRDVMIFLQSHGVSSGYATKIFKHYGTNSILVVKKNPYKLATDIFGIGFLTADRIAEKLGFAKDSKVRIEAGIIYVLNQLSDEGHVYYPYESLIVKCREILQTNKDILVEALEAVALEKKIVIEELHHLGANNEECKKAVYLSKFHFCETNIAISLKKLASEPMFIHIDKTDEAIMWAQKRLSIVLAQNQIKAIKCAVENKVMVITGGPGTGKTTIINALLKIFSKLEIKIMLSAPTGRAAKRMSETTDYEARTIHRLLEFSFQKGGFQKNEENPLNCNVLIVDEASMIDTILMYHLLKAIPSESTFILVGDVNQLPSVGAGNILNDIIESNAVPVVKLDKIFRQAKQSQIIVNAHKINSGIIPALQSSEKSESDFYFIHNDDPEKVVEIILKLVKERIPQRFGFDSVDDIQVLTPLHKGVTGVINLNVRLQNELNSDGNGVTQGSKVYRVKDKVMQIKNNYDKDVFNGDIGRIVKISTEDQEVIICFDGRNIAYDFSSLDEIILAYAVSVHKSQGSEYPVVIIPILTQHYILLQRNLIYTAVTRGRKLVVMVGTAKAMAIGIKNNKTQKRHTYLKHRLL